MDEERRLAGKRVRTVDKEWQLGMLTEVIHKHAEIMTNMERAALYQAHLVFAVADFEALMDLHIAWSLRARKKGKSRLERWNTVAGDALGDKWPKLSVVPWANDENHDPKTIQDWFAGLTAMRNNIVHARPADEASKQQITAAGLPTDTWRLGEDYLDRFGTMSNWVMGTMFRVTEALHQEG